MPGSPGTRATFLLLKTTLHILITWGSNTSSDFLKACYVPETLPGFIALQHSYDGSTTVLGTEKNDVQRI